MNLFNWREKTNRQRVFLILTIVVTVMLVSHPELRLLLPLIDALGLELLLVLMGGQLLDYLRPALHVLRDKAVRPLASAMYSVVLFFFGIAAPQVDVWGRRYGFFSRSRSLTPMAFP